MTKFTPRLNTVLYSSLLDEFLYEARVRRIACMKYIYKFSFAM